MKDALFPIPILQMKKLLYEKNKYLPMIKEQSWDWTLAYVVPE